MRRQSALCTHLARSCRRRAAARHCRADRARDCTHFCDRHFTARPRRPRRSRATTIGEPVTVWYQVTSLLPSLSAVITGTGFWRRASCRRRQWPRKPARCSVLQLCKRSVRPLLGCGPVLSPNRRPRQRQPEPEHRPNQRDVHRRAPGNTSPTRRSPADACHRHFRQHPGP